MFDPDDDYDPFAADDGYDAPDFSPDDVRALADELDADLQSRFDDEDDEELAEALDAAVRKGIEIGERRGRERERAEILSALSVVAALNGSGASVVKAIAARGVEKGFDPNEPRDEKGEWTTGGGGGEKHGADVDTPEAAGEDAAMLEKPKEPHEMTREEYEGHRTAIPLVYGVWNEEVGDDRYSKRVSQTDQVFEKVVKRKMAEVTPGEEWPFPPVDVKRESGPYDLKDGHHRIEVAKRLGVRIIPAVLTDPKAFGHTKPVNTFVEIDDDGEPRIIQPNNEKLPPIKVTVPEKRPGKKKPDYNKEHRAAVKDALAAGKPVPPEVLKDYPDLAAKHAAPIVQKAAERHTGDDPDDDAHHAVFLAALAHAEDCLGRGDDPQPGLARLHDLLHDPDALAGVVEKAQWREDLHPRDDAGRWVSVTAIHAAKHDPGKAAELRKRVTAPEERAKLDAALKGDVDVGHTRESQKREDARQRREVKRMSRDEARRLASDIMSTHPDHLTPQMYADLIPHLDKLTVAELRSVRLKLGASWGIKSPKRQQMVERLVAHARGEADALARDYSRLPEGGLLSRARREAVKEHNEPTPEESFAVRDTDAEDAGVAAPKTDPAADLPEPAPEVNKPALSHAGTPEPDHIAAVHAAIDRADEARDPVAKDYLESALYNSDGSPEDLAAQLGGALDTVLLGQKQGTFVTRDVPPSARAALEGALTAMGAEYHGPDEGEEVEYDPKHHQPGGAAFPGDSAKVVRRPLVMGGKVVARGEVSAAPAKTPKGGGKVDLSDPQALAEAVHDAARAVPDVFGKPYERQGSHLRHKAGLRDVYDHLAASGRIPKGTTFEQFGSALLAANAAGALDLGRFDLVQQARPGYDVAANVVRHPAGAEMDIVNVPKDAPEPPAAKTPKGGGKAADAGAGAGESEPDPATEPTTPHAHAAEQAEASGATPREVADAVTDAAKSDYAFARASAVGNAGEDLKGSARHKRNEWRGLAQAEADGTAKELVTRANLTKNEPHALAANSEPHSALSHLAAHLALNLFPAEPGDYPAAYDKYKNRDGGPLARTTPEKLREQYLNAYRQIKDVAERAAQDETDPRATLKKIAEKTKELIDEYRGVPKDATGYERASSYSATDPYNPVANALIALHNRAIGSGAKSNHVMSRVLDFGKRLKEKYGGATPEVLEKANQHAIDVMEGDSFNKTFGTTKEGPGYFSPAEAYVAHATRKGGRVIDASTVKAGTDFVMNGLKMRGLQWGNSVSDEERQHHLTKSAEALADLADVTGLPDSAMSLGGKLGLAIGARGKGTASAHYEPGTKVINLTRKKGVGTLAHEWGHALDHDLAGGGLVQRDGKTHGEYLSRGNLTDSDSEVHAAMSEVRKAFAESGFEDAARDAFYELKKQRRIPKTQDWNDYWGARHELFARAFERHVQHKLQSEGRENTYLSGLGGTSGLWPTAEHAEKMAPAFDKLLTAVRKHYAGKAEKKALARKPRRKKPA